MGLMWKAKSLQVMSVDPERDMVKKASVRSILWGRQLKYQVVEHLCVLVMHIDRAGSSVKSTEARLPDSGRKLSSMTRSCLLTGSWRATLVGWQRVVHARVMHGLGAGR